MGEIVRGQDVSINVIDGDGAVVLILNPTSFSRNLDSDEERQQRLGDREEPPRQMIHGFSGSMAFEEESSVLDDLLDLMIARYIDAAAVFTIDVIETTFYPLDGTSRSYNYPDAVFKVNKDASGKNDPTELSVEWTSKLRQEI